MGFYSIFICVYINHFSFIEIIFILPLFGITSVLYNVPVLLVLYIGFFISNTSLSYLISYKFNDPEKAQLCVYFINTIGVILQMTFYMLTTVGATCNFSYNISYFLNIIPIYAFGNALTNIIGYDNIDVLLNTCSVYNTGSVKYIINISFFNHNIIL